MVALSMNNSKFNSIISELGQLTDKQSRELEIALQAQDPIATILRQIESRLIEHPECPHCYSNTINRHGKINKTQRYRCKNCLKTFVATTKTPLARLRLKERWGDYFNCMLQGKPLRGSAHECGINLKTSFRWRHRFLTLPSQQKAAKLEGIIEADETFFAYSEKGSRELKRPPKKRGDKAGKRGRSSEDWVPVVTLRDRGKQTYEAVMPHVTAKKLSEELKGKLEKDSVLCTDGFKVYIKFSKDNELTHKRLNISHGVRVIEKVFHIQNVNAYHSRLKMWMQRFHGVATKYLENYLGWFRFMDDPKNCNTIRLFKAQQQLNGT